MRQKIVALGMPDDWVHQEAVGIGSFQDLQLNPPHDREVIAPAGQEPRLGQEGLHPDQGAFNRNDLVAPVTIIRTRVETYSREAAIKQAILDGTPRR